MNNRLGVLFGVMFSGLAAAPLTLAVPSIEVDAIVGPALAPPAGAGANDSETGAPLARTAVSIADELLGSWEYSALSDIAIPKLAILGSIDNSGGGSLAGEFGGELPLLGVSATLRDTITIIAPSPEPYILTAELVVDGVLQVDGSNGRANAQITIDPIDQLSASQFRSYTSNATIVDDRLPVSFNFTGDAEFELITSLFFFVNVVDPGAIILADFSNSAIVNLVVTSLAGDVIENIVIASESGSFGTATPIPVPAALPLLMSALAVLAWRRRRS